MSGNTPFGVRRMASPSTKQGPLKATLPFSFFQSSPTRNVTGKKSSPASSPVPLWSAGKSRRSPESRTSPERISPVSPAAFKVERPKPIRPSPTSGIKRTSSLDAITVPYLTSQCTRSEIPHLQMAGPDCLDKGTQTPLEWEDFLEEKRRRKGSHKRSSSAGNNSDSLKEFKARLAKTKEGSRSPVVGHHSSPFQAYHLAIISSSNQTGAGLAPSKSIAIPFSQHSMRNVSPVRIRNSVEGLNQEIEIALGDSRQLFRCQDSAPDGHRAPVQELTHLGGSSSPQTRTIDTQTPSQLLMESLSLAEEESPSSSSRPHSESPNIPIIAGAMESPTRSPSQAELKVKNTAVPNRQKSVEKEMETAFSDKITIESSFEKCAASPRPNKSFTFAREPPDGCEKVKIIEEIRKVPLLKEPLLYCQPVRECPPLIPSTVSAFLPLASCFRPVVDHTRSATYASSFSSSAYNSGSSGTIPPLETQ